MKKFCALALCLLMTPVAAFAIPIPWTPAEWHDSIYFGDAYIGDGGSRSYTHNINDNGFDVFNDLVTNYQLMVGIRDDQRFDQFEIIRVNQPGFFGDAIGFGAQDINAGWSIAGWFSLNLSGMLDVTVESLRGDFVLESSTLWAHGYGHDKPTDIPEPGSLALLGLGLVGLGLARRRLISKK